MSNYKREEEELFLSRYATIGTKGRRIKQELDAFRTEFQRDVHRIIYCQSFRRLRHKTQVFYFPQNDHVSTRMDHVRFVASAARTVARCLRLNEDLAEAIGLAHDIGHPPFGHQGEDFLTEILNEHDELKDLMPVFSHEVYGLRVVDHIAKRDRERPGLNLTWEVRDGIISHWGEDYKTRKLSPGNISKDLANIKTRKEAGIPATMEGCIVRLIDKIAYVGKDVEDAIEAAIIDEDDVPAPFKEELGTTNGQIIGTFLEDMIRTSMGHDYVAISQGKGDLLREMIEFNKLKIYHSAGAERYKEQAGKTIRYLFYDLLKEIRRTERFQKEVYPDPNVDGSVPTVYRVFQNFVTKDMKDSYNVGEPDQLIVLDFIAGMTDSFAMRSVGEIFIPKTTV